MKVNDPAISKPTSGVGDVAVTLGARVASVVPQLAIQGCLAWFLEPAGRGTYAVCVMVSTSLTAVFLFGCDVAGQYFVASRRFSVSEGVSLTLAIASVGGLVAMALAAGAAAWPVGILKGVEPELILLTTGVGVVQLWWTALVVMLAALRRFSYRAVVYTTQAFLRLLGVVVLVKVAGWGVEGALLANLLCSLLTAAWILGRLRWRFSLRWVRPRVAEVRRLVAYGARYYVASLGNLLNAQIGVLILAFFVSQDQIGFFAAGAAIMMNVVLIPDAVAAVLQPRIAGDVRGRPELTALAMRVVGVLCGTVVVLLAVFARPIVEWLLSPKFLPAVTIMWILAPGTALRSTTKIIVPYLNGTNHPGVFSIATLLGTVCNFGLLVVLLPRMGLNGAAWAMTGGALVSSAVLIVAFRRFSGLTLGQTWMPAAADWDVFVQSWEQLRRRRESPVG